MKEVNLNEIQCIGDILEIMKHDDDFSYFLLQLIQKIRDIEDNNPQ